MDRTSDPGEVARAGRLLAELSIAAAGIGSFDWDLASGRLSFDDRLIELFGYERETFPETIDAFYDRLHPHDLARVSALVQAAIDGCGEYAADYRVTHPGGTVRWVSARGRVLGDEGGTPVRMLGAAFDTTARHGADVHVAQVLESMPTAFFSVDRRWRFTYVNAVAEALFAVPRSELLGEDLWRRFPRAGGTDVETRCREAVRTGAPAAFDAHYPAPREAWYEVRAWPNPDGLAVYVLDVSARRRAQQLAERETQRSALLAEVTAALTGTLDAEEAVARLARIVVPHLADWCVITLVDDDGSPGTRRSLRDVGTWHVDEGLRALTEQYAQGRLRDLTPDAPLLRAQATGAVQLVDACATRVIQSVLRPGVAHDLVAQLAPEVVAVLPLRGRGRTVGILSLFRGADRGAFSDVDLATAADVADRAGLALDSARLYRQQLHLAEGLQRSMLTAPPAPDHLHVTVRYVPAAEAARVGGDWYDSFVQPGGATVVVIGDVVGHDTASAAAMGQLRSMLRALGAVDDDGPAQVLRKVDQVVATLHVATTASAVVARLERPSAEHERDPGPTRLQWSNAGHPPPMVIDPSGAVAPLLAAQSDLLLGILPCTARAQSEVDLHPGSTVLLYTDGLVERRGQSLEAGLAVLQETLTELARRDLDPDALCDELLRRMLPRHPTDDVALVAVRLRPSGG